MLEAPEAYRILKRPSSVLSAKASTIRPSGRHTPRKNPNDSFKRQTTNHHTVKNDHKTIDLETRLQKRAWRNRDKANRIKILHCSRPLSSSQTTTHPDRTRPATRKADGVPPGHPENRTHPKRMRVAVREPKSISTPLPAGPNGTREANDLFHTSTPTPKPGTIPGAWATRRTPDRRPEKLRRKEVIQPHLPVRLPCYDLVPITSLTLDGSIHKGLGHRLRVLPTFMT